MNNSIIIDGHRGLMGAVLWGVQSVHTGMNDVVQAVLIGLDVSQVMFFPRKMVLTILAKV